MDISPIYSIHINNSIKPATCPNISAKPPIQGVIKAPPDTPIIIKADTSLDCSGRCSNAKENRIENTFEQAKPTSTIITPMLHKLSEISYPTKARIAISMLPLKKGRAEILANNIAPRKEPPVRAAK